MSRPPGWARPAAWSSPYCSLGGGTRPHLHQCCCVNIESPQLLHAGSLLRSALRTRLLISLSLSGPTWQWLYDRSWSACLSAFLIHLWPWTKGGTPVAGRCACALTNLKARQVWESGFILYLSRKYLATAGTPLFGPLSNCRGKLCIWAGRLVHIAHPVFLLMAPQW